MNAVSEASRSGRDPEIKNRADRFESARIAQIVRVMIVLVAGAAEQTQKISIRRALRHHCRSRSVQKLRGGRRRPARIVSVDNGGVAETTADKNRACKTRQRFESRINFHSFCIIA
jgi:hypothetical protein